MRRLLIIALAFVAGAASYRYAVRIIPPPATAAVERPVNPYYDVRRGVFAVAKPVANPVVMLGDSIIEQGPWAELTGCRNIVNRGIGSDTTAGVLSRIDEITALKPKRVYLMVGVNDAIKNFDLDRSAENIRATMRALNAASIETVRFSILPVAGRFAEAIPRIDELNRKAGDAAPVGVTPSDLSFDGVHLRASGMAKIAEKIVCD